ncbi:MAG: haloalkane dehalogenase [Candidatus Aminicenantes bacterium]|nr:MAG: haloalkane dehalogenase [Candidatus Aminicenantes bacterium]
MISAEFPFESKFIDVLGTKMHYIDEGEGIPFLFLHGNPTSSYLWRNIIPHVKPLGRVIAVDLIGMGKSDKPDIDYRFSTHIKYIDEFIRLLDLKDIVLIIHDWGSGIGFNYAMNNESNVKGIVFMEAVLWPMYWREFPFVAKFLFKRFRHPKKGPKMIVKNNFFVEKVLPNFMVRKLTQQEMDHYREPFLEESSRKPVLVWPNEIPIDGYPADNTEIVKGYYEKLKQSDIPKLLLWAKPGAIIKEKHVEKIRQAFKNLQDVYLGKGKHYLQEDHPDEIGKAIVEWYQSIN